MFPSLVPETLLFYLFFYVFFFFGFFPALTYTVNWEADENGFRADAPHLPQPVAIPFPEVAEAVEAQLRFAASQPAYVEPEN